MRITPETAKAIADDMRAAMAEIGKRHGMTFEVGRMNWNATKIVARVEGSIRDADGNSVADRTEWDMAARMGEVEAAWFGTTFVARGVEHRIAGFSFRSSKRPIATKTADGKEWRWPVEAVRRMITVAKAG